MKRVSMHAVLVSLALLGPTAPSTADVATAAGTALSATTVADRDGALAELEAARQSDPLAAYASGAVHFFKALEGLGQGLHRHGFDSPQSFMLPLMRLPVPENPQPEPLTYEQFRAIIGSFRDELLVAAEQLAGVPANADIGVEVDLARLGIDLNADGAIGAGESALAIMAALNQNMAADPQSMPPMVFRFDRADGYWLQGYANFLIAQADFWLAHDFRSAFDGSFHMLFPRAGLPLQEALVPLDNGAGSMFASEWRIADFISFVHMVNWPVAEPELRREARGHLLEMIRLSRENWKAIRAETDNVREWLPGPQQKGVNQLTGLEVGETEVQAWHAALAMAEDLLEGRTLLPHFRIADKGINMKRFFEEPRTFDLVLSITGPAIVPYLETGRLLTAEEFESVRQQFGGTGFMTFALWFN